MDDRYDRRALLLHLGNVLELLHCLQNVGDPEKRARDVAQTAAIVDGSGLLDSIASSTTVRELVERATGAYNLWPKELLDAELNRRALAETVRHDLFPENADGWRAFCDVMRRDVAWFGEGVLAAGPELAQAATAAESNEPVSKGDDVALARRSEEDRKKSWPYVPADGAAG